MWRHEWCVPVLQQARDTWGTAHGNGEQAAVVVDGMAQQGVASVAPVSAEELAPVVSNEATSSILSKPVQV